MSEYKRFVSYIYEYQKDIKKRNCGFSRVEVRDGHCKIEVHMKFPPFPYTPTFQVYAFVHSNEQLLGILLGEAACSRGTVYGLFQPDPDSVGGQYPFDDLGGLIIQSDAGGIYATGWTDLALHPESFLPPEAVQAASVESEGEIVPEEFPVSAQEQENTGEASPETPGHSFCPYSFTDPGASCREAPDPENVSCGSASSGPLTDPDQSVSARPQEPAPASPAGSPELLQAASGSGFSDTRQPPQTSQEAQGSFPGRQEPEDTDSQPIASPEDFPTGPLPSPEDILRGTRPDTNESESSAGRWQLLQDTYPHIRPFPDGQIHDCVQLTLKDLPDLRKHSWFLGSNQFLAHSCQVYQHFFLGIFQDDTGKDSGYVMGVPGTYDEKERFLAGMFGFPNFKPSGGQAIRPGQFGYWYRFIY